uniref:Benzyl alcohol O-benzoyltransferase n=1 Tax=Ananas comosus var. bracteatus TaxID=296719 RepID=A0A6V7NR99_ANACO|nr:unnamed protein product [Ananas comosus var. bracteatus]
MFMEADADVAIDDFGDVLAPPIPGHEMLLCEPEGAGGVVDRPLFYIQLVRHCLFFGPSEVAALRAGVPARMSRCSRFDMIAALVWKCRTEALQYERENEVRIQFVVNARRKRDPPLPAGFYGNAFVFAVASTPPGSSASGRSSDGRVYAVGGGLPGGAGPAAVRGGADVPGVGHHERGFGDVDFGWGKGVYGGPPTANLATFHIRSKNAKGEEGILVPMCLPAPAMARFQQEIASNIAKMRTILDHEAIQAH